MHSQSFTYQEFSCLSLLHFGMWKLVDKGPFISYKYTLQFPRQVMLINYMLIFHKVKWYVHILLTIDIGQQFCTQTIKTTTTTTALSLRQCLNHFCETLRDFKCTKKFLHATFTTCIYHSICIIHLLLHIQV